MRDRRVDSSRNTADGQEIGLARIYDFALESGSYDAQNGNVNQWDLSLFDVQFQTNITLNESTTLSVPTFIKGKYSGATAFLRSDVSDSTSISVYEKTGDFLVNEPFIFNGVEDSRVATAVTSFGMSDVKSIYGGPDISVGPGAAGIIKHLMQIQFKKLLSKLVLLELLEEIEQLVLVQSPVQIQTSQVF